MDNYVIDRSRLSEEDNAKFDEIIAKALVDPEAAKEEMKDQEPSVPPKKKTPEKEEVEDMTDTKKSAPEEPKVPQFVLDAIAKSDEFIAAQERKDMLDVAKKYATLVENVEELADQLSELKKSSPKMYETSIAMMDKQMAMITKGDGLFGEIGKSAGGYSTGGDADAKADAKAHEIMKAYPGMTYTEAKAKAWEDPALMAECDAEYFG